MRVSYLLEVAGRQSQHILLLWDSTEPEGVEMRQEILSEVKLPIHWHKILMTP